MQLWASMSTQPSRGQERSLGLPAVNEEHSEDFGLVDVVHHAPDLRCVGRGARAPVVRRPERGEVRLGAPRGAPTVLPVAEKPNIDGASSFCPRCSRRSLRRLRRKLLADHREAQEAALHREVLALHAQLSQRKAAHDIDARMAMLKRCTAILAELRRLMEASHQAALREAARQARRSGQRACVSDILLREAAWLREELLLEQLLFDDWLEPRRRTRWAWARKPRVAICVAACALACCYLLLRPQAV